MPSVGSSRTPVLDGPPARRPAPAAAAAAGELAIRRACSVGETERGHQPLWVRGLAA
ncbi:hypothetical protein I552_0033 [Mycobacterium xenopi 3993]|nr:hypothetical protein I552_0033 [Mycobacterium xenopi 3993]